MTSVEWHQGRAAAILGLARHRVLERVGNLARHLSTLAALISGIVGSKSTQLPTIAAKVPNGTKPESRVKRFARWVDNAHILEEVYFLPYADLFAHFFRDLSQKRRRRLLAEAAVHPALV